MFNVFQTHIHNLKKKHINFNETVQHTLYCLITISILFSFFLAVCAFGSCFRMLAVKPVCLIYHCQMFVQILGSLRLVRGVSHNPQQLCAQRLYLRSPRPLRPEGDCQRGGRQDGWQTVRGGHEIPQSHAADVWHWQWHLLRLAACVTGHRAQPRSVGLPHNAHQPAAAAGDHWRWPAFQNNCTALDGVHERKAG